MYIANDEDSHNFVTQFPFDSIAHRRYKYACVCVSIESGCGEYGAIYSSSFHEAK